MLLDHHWQTVVTKSVVILTQMRHFELSRFTNKGDNSFICFGFDSKISINDPIRCFFPIQVASHLFIPKHKPFSVAHCQVAKSFQTQSKANFPSRLTNN